MTIPVWVEQQNGRFTATVLGAPQLRAEGTTKDEAVRALRNAVDDRRTRGELVLLDVPEPQPRRYTAEEIELLRELTAEAYRYRDELKRQEFPE